MRELLTRTQDPHRHEVLRYLVEGGQAALDELSQASGRTSASLLAHLLAEDTMVADGAALAPPARSTRRRKTRRHQLLQG